MTSTTEGPDASARPNDDGAPLRRSRHLAWAASALAALAVGVAAALLAAPAPRAPQPSASELALAAAEDDAVRLAAAAGSLAAAGPEPARAAADSAASVLGLQAAVLRERPQLPQDDAGASPSPSGTRSPSDTPSDSASPSPTAAVQPPTPGDLARGLAESAGRRMADVVRVDGPTASALASVAAGQLLAARSLDPLVADAASAATTSAAPAACPSPGPDPAAFEAVQTAEAAGVWTYTVLAARAGGEERAGRLDAASAHEAQLALLGRAAGESCVALPPRPPGAALPADAGSAASLAAVEESAAQAWADLVGSAAPGARPAAAEGLAQAAARRAAAGPLDPAAAAFPGHRAAQEEATSLAARGPAAD
ncbi:DUF4439 domain-containing protein [Sinomonas mesophila]|uniref:DUF4439 domain-containing protein n=1 Tax=Sinomonas mesophila TaxID=1531955 RepID=UPI0009858B90|nr:DUF4439 domain-containing protein [Sinomonas mesophila]